MGITFDPATAKEANALRLKLRELGVVLDGLSWKIEAVYWNPFGFDFITKDWHRVQAAADKSNRLTLDATDMPGYDPWRKANILSVGFSEPKKPPYLHLDVALNQPGLCRVYIRPHGATLVDHMGTAASAASVYAKDPIVRKVTRALSVLRLPLESYGIRVTRIYRRPEPEGFDFDCDDPVGLQRAAATIPELSPDDRRNLEGRLAAKVTVGQGYRQTGFGPRIHLEVAQNGKCNVHIDLEGWVVGRDQWGRSIYDWVHGITNHFPEDLLPGHVGRPLVGAVRGIEWRPTIGVEHGRERDESDSHWLVKLGFVFVF